MSDARKKGSRKGTKNDRESTKLETAVEEINRELVKQDAGNMAVGEIVDKLLGPKGRAEYGKRVLAKLAAHPDLMCTGEHLRQCWHYCRLMRDHGAMLREKFPKLKYGHLYQISRLLQLRETNDRKTATDAIKAMAKKAMDKSKGGKPMPADALGKAVTTHINSIKGKSVEEVPDAYDQLPAPTVDEKAEQEKLDAAFEQLDIATHNAEEAVSTIKAAGSLDRVSTDAQLTLRLGQAYLESVRFIVEQGAGDNVLPGVRSLVRDLGELAGIAVVETVNLVGAEGEGVAE